MTLKSRFSIWFSILFSLVVGILFLSIFKLFADYRREDFKERLSAQADQKARELDWIASKSDVLNPALIKMGNANLVNQKFVLYNQKAELVFTSDASDLIISNPGELLNKTDFVPVYFQEGSAEVFVCRYNIGDQDYLIAVKAEDFYGNAKLNYLRNLLLWAFVLGLLTVILLANLIVRRALMPMDRLRDTIQNTTFQNLNKPIHIGSKRDEISTLAKSFNHLLVRLEKSSRLQREFTGNASHELRTPMARISSQLQNLLQDKELSDNQRHVLFSIKDDTDQLAQIVTSLLILSRMDEADARKNFVSVRVDEIIFEASDDFSRQNPDFRMAFEIDNRSSEETSLEVWGDEVLLKIAFSNLLKNGYLYSDDKTVHVTLIQEEHGFMLNFRNNGPVPRFENSNSMFQAFARGSNSQNLPGSGLGLRIVQRIIHYHQAEVYYHSEGDNDNQITIQFSNLG
ncbi:MAG: HAMP domain-containing histidine kinase [Bacteroidetes bacterium]|nr:HAMP domain-containing histidine kinase [Bacteroidota bacterium]MCK6610818.1 HAMP domain-containing histidine kinase [Bacteroidia bacterium]